MAQTYANEVAVQYPRPGTVSQGALAGARVRRWRGSIDLAAQASGDTVVLANIPSGHAFVYGVVTASATLGTSTVAIGTAADAGKYRAAATFTTVDTPTLFGKSSAVGGAVHEEVEQVILTIGAAALPSSGKLVVDLLFAAP